MTSISIIVCCYNSASRISDTLKHLALQKLSKEIDCEVIVVDNNSSDDTSEIARSEWERNGSPFPLNIISEPKPGLSHARQTGVLAAKNEYICFCDDDNWLCENYIQTALEIMNANSEIGVLAGQGVAVSDVEIPNWFYTRYGAFACGVLAMDSGDVTEKQWVWGAGMILRKGVLLSLYQAGFKHLTLDREGEKLTSGGDNEICYWHILVGYKLWYDERLVFKHFMPQSRLTKEKAKALFEGQKESTMAIKPYKKLILSRKEKKSLAGLSKGLVHYLIGNKDSVYVLKYLPWLLREEREIIENIEKSVAQFQFNSMKVQIDNNFANNALNWEYKTK